MILKVFSVRDMKAQAFLQPFFSNSNGSAMRAFGDAVQDSTCPFNKHPEDYVMYEIGSYDDSTAELMVVTPVKMLCSAADFVAAAAVVKGTNCEPIGPVAMATELVLNGKKSS